MTQGDSCTIRPKLTFLLCFLRNLSNVSHFVALVRPSVPCPPLSSSPACHAKFRSSREEEEEGDGANRTVKGPSGGKGMLRVVFLRKILAMYIFPILCKICFWIFFFDILYASLGVRVSSCQPANIAGERRVEEKGETFFLGIRRLKWRPDSFLPRVLSVPPPGGKSCCMFWKKSFWRVPRWYVGEKGEEGLSFEKKSQRKFRPGAIINVPVVWFHFEKNSKEVS